MSLKRTLNPLKKIGLSELEEEMPVITDEPKIPGYLCFPNNKAKEKYRVEESFGQGFDTNRTNAKIKCTGELLERLCLFNPQENNLVKSRFINDSHFADPSMFFCYSEEQFPNREGHIKKLREGEYLWWKTQDLTNNKEIYVPAQLIFLSSRFSEEPTIRKEQISTGAALGQKDSKMAFKSGLLEIVERDACISSYLTKRKIKKIIDLPEDLSRLVEYLERYQLETNTFDVTTNLKIPSVLAVTIDDTGIGNAVNVGSKASLNYHDAIKYSILESIQCRRASRVTKRFTYNKTPNKNEIFSMDDRFYYWHEKARIQDIKFLLDTKENVSYKELKKGCIFIEEAIESIKSFNYHIFIADISLPEIKKEGFETLKVLIPELHPLYLDERAKSLYSIHHGEIKEDLTLNPHPIT